ncbi:MAG: hypothetical protein F2667_00755 [Actinobacteria bacterium]|uniref:Unannotated protein n=1 Tax=freshwater metagenome TaxID=449393 RepID=A0A6J6NP61_9ZZZZ|nr:hypothetical protein [Actinomycetota bacterium]
MSVRAYVPATYELLATYDADGSVPTTGAVTALDESEEAEYSALIDAAVASADLGGSDGRRVVVVVEVDTVGPAATMRQVVAVHVDTEPGAEPDDDLGWYAAQEIPHLLA